MALHLILEEKLSLEYALITSSSLPEKVKESDYYCPVDRAQWLDLVDYAQDIVDQDKDQRILFLIVAKGTEEQETADAALKEEALQEQTEAAEALQEKQRAEAEAAARAKAEKEKSQRLRAKSKSIFNALYNR